MNEIKKIFVFVGLLSLFGCATQTYHLRGGADALPNQEILQSFFVSGLGQEVELNASEVCGGADKVAKVQSKMNFLDGFLGVISLGIYTPRTAMVYCVKNEAES